MNQRRPLFGVETEYAVTAMKDGAGIEREEILHAMMDVARQQLVHLPDLCSAGMFLQNGSRFYLDCGQHPEFATPECADPWSVVRYLQAGHHIIGQLARAVESRYAPGTEVMCFRNNVDYGGTRSTWGSHESYLHRMNPTSLPAQIVPHLVSRIVYTGAGGFNSLSSGLEFTLSPRVAHIGRVVSGESTTDRGIFHTKNEPLGRQDYNRLHIICGESLCSETAMFLRIGVTALVIAMAEAGLNPGGEVQLEAPIEALRTFAADTTCKKDTRIKNWRRMTAIDIQRHYLHLAEAHAHEKYMPEWTGYVCHVWRDILDRLSNDPRATERILDWSIKLAMYTDQAAKLGMPWERLAFWNGIVNRLDAALEAANCDPGELSLNSVIGPKSPIREHADRFTKVLRARGMDWDELREILAARQRFCEIDTRFGQLDARGIFQSLNAAGVLQHHVPGVDNIEDAVANPPTFGRARIRGQVIQRLAGGGRSRCDWQHIVNPEGGQTLDLSDPFASEETWRPMRRDDTRYSPVAAELFQAVVDQTHAEEQDRYTRRREASDRILAGDYPGAEALVRGLLRERFEVPSTHCHLARILLMTDREGEAREQVACAWEARSETNTYVVARILFFQCLFAMFDAADIAPMVGQIKSILNGPSAHMDWTVLPMLNRLRPQLGRTNFQFMRALAAALSDASALSRLEDFPAWRDAAATAFDATTEVTQVSAEEQRIGADGCYTS